MEIRTAPTVQKVKEYFEHVNEVNSHDGGEHVVPFTDQKHYTEQIQNIYKVDLETAQGLALALTQH